MDMTFIGHQSWLVSSQETHILIDPLLDDGFGYDTIHGIEIYPPRDIDLNQMPPISAIVLSHEHSDHFHMPSLLHFTGVPIYTSHLISSCISNMLKDNRLEHRPVYFDEMISVGNIEMTLFPAGNETVFWESRVAQIYLREKNKLGNAVFIAVDALISDRLKEKIDEGEVESPKTIVLSNNSQITPKGVLGSLDNMKQDAQKNKGIVGLKILHELLIAYIDELAEIRNFIICGGGFMKKYDTFFGAFPFSEQDKLAAIGQQLVPEKNLCGLLPGEVLHIDEDLFSLDTVDWITINDKRLQELEQAKAAFQCHQTAQYNIIKPVLPPFASQKSFENAKVDVEAELIELAKAMMLSPLGQSLLKHASLSNTDDVTRPLIFRFLKSAQDEEDSSYVLDINAAKFIVINNKNLAFNTPFGIECFLRDFWGIIKGEIQIWDIAGIALRSWYVGEILSSPVGFLYGWYGELLVPDRHYSCYQNRWFQTNSKQIKTAEVML